MATVKLSSKNQVVIPKEIRKNLKLHAGIKISIYTIDANRAVIVKSPTSAVEALEGLGKEIWDSLGGSDKYLKKERVSWKKYE